MTGRAVRKFLEKYPCKFCESLLIEDFNKFDHNYASLKGSHKYFTFLKSNGGLIFPSKFVFDIICHTEKCFKILMNSTQSIKTPDFKHKIINTVHNHFSSILQRYSTHPIVDTEMSENLHESRIIEFIASFYATARICRNCKDSNLQLNELNVGLRQQLTKLILFYNL